MQYFLLLACFFLCSCSDHVQRLHIIRNTTSAPKPSLVVEPVTTGYPKDSQSLAHSVLGKLLQEQRLHYAHIQSASYFGHVLLVGQVENSDDVDFIQQQLTNNTKVRSFKLFLNAHSKHHKVYLAEDSLLKTQAVKILSNIPIATSHLQLLCSDNTIYIIGSSHTENIAHIKHVLFTQTRAHSVYFFGV